MTDTQWLPLRIGEHVKIYHDPITETEAEGDAHIVGIVFPPDADGMGRYKVRFEDESQTYTRNILSLDQK